MKVYHVRIEQDEGWFCAQCLENTSIITQARNLDELVWMLRDAIALMSEVEGEGEARDVQLELIIPPDITGNEPPRELFDETPSEEVMREARTE